MRSEFQINRLYLRSGLDHQRRASTGLKRNEAAESQRSGVSTVRFRSVGTPDDARSGMALHS